MKELLLRQEVARLRPVVQLITRLDGMRGLTATELQNLQHVAERALKVQRLPVELTNGYGGANEML